MTAKPKKKAYKLTKLSERDAVLIRITVDRLVSFEVMRAKMQLDESDDAPPKCLIEYYLREEWSLGQLVAELLRHYRACGATWADLKRATGYAMSDIKELVNGSGDAGKI